MEPCSALAADFQPTIAVTAPLNPTIVQSFALRDCSRFGDEEERRQRSRFHALLILHIIDRSKVKYSRLRLTLVTQSLSFSKSRNKLYGKSSEMATNGYHNNGTMNTSMVRPKFLRNQEDLGIVAVGFSGGQVCSDPIQPEHRSLSPFSLD